jgi:hypothetical protein
VDTLDPVTGARLYPDPAPLRYLLPRGWQQHGNFIRHVIYVSTFCGCWYRWQLSDEGLIWKDWLAT